MTNKETTPNPHVTKIIHKDGLEKSKKRILVIDDSLHYLKCLIQELKEYGFDPVAVLYVDEVQKNDPFYCGPTDEEIEEAKKSLTVVSNPEDLMKWINESKSPIVDGVLTDYGLSESFRGTEIAKWSRRGMISLPVVVHSAEGAPIIHDNNGKISVNDCEIKRHTGIDTVKKGDENLAAYLIQHLQKNADLGIN